MIYFLAKLMARHTRINPFIKEAPDDVIEGMKIESNGGAYSMLRLQSVIHCNLPPKYVRITRGCSRTQGSMVLARSGLAATINPFNRQRGLAPLSHKSLAE
jgi:hypothetical protein